MFATGRIDCTIRTIIIPALLTIILSGCAPRLTVDMGRTECAPTNLTVMSNDHRLFLKWDTNCPDDVLLSGYYIYVSEKPIYDLYHNKVLPGRIKPFNHDPYPGDTDPESRYETMEIQNLDNGVEFFVSIRSLFPDRTISVSSNEVAVLCRPEGDFELAFRYSDLDDGFSLSAGAAVRADSDENDLYFFHKDGFDFIASPHRLNGFLRKTKFYSLGKTKDIYQYPKLDLDIPSVEKMPIKATISRLRSSSR